MKQACSVSPEALGWLTLYLAELAADGFQAGASEPLWWTPAAVAAVDLHRAARGFGANQQDGRDHDDTRMACGTLYAQG